MDQNNWYEHFKDHSHLNLAEVAALREKNGEFLGVIQSITPRHARLLDAGSGPAKRMISFVKDSPLSMLLIDRDPKIVALAKANADQVLARNVVPLSLDFFELAERFPPDSFDIITHHGVLEHYEEDEVRRILNIQLKVAARIVFATVTESPFNVALFANNGIQRNLWTVEHWLKKILQPFYVVEHHVVHTNRDELIVRIDRP